MGPAGDSMSLPFAGIALSPKPKTAVSVLLLVWEAPTVPLGTLISAY